MSRKVHFCVKFVAVTAEETGVSTIFALGELRMKQSIMAYLKDESGQTSTEYILLVAVVALIVFKFKEIATTKLTELTGQVFDNASGILDQIQ